MSGDRTKTEIARLHWSKCVVGTLWVAGAVNAVIGWFYTSDVGVIMMCIGAAYLLDDLEG